MKKIYSTAMAAMFSATAFAQLNMGVATSNWSGTNSLYLNPANIAGSRHKLVIDVVTAIGGVDNSTGTIDINRGLINDIRHGQARDIFRYPDGYSGPFSMQAPYAEVRGPGLLYNFHQNHCIALTTRIRAMNQFHNFDHSLYQAVTDPGFASGGNVDLTSQNFNYTAHLWEEVGLTYGGVIYDHGNGRLKGGVTLRYLGGIDYIALKGKNLDAHFVSGRDSFYAANSDLEYASNFSNAQDAVDNGFTTKSLVSQFFGPKAGVGWGGDIGLAYEFTPVDEILGSRGDYKFRISASVIDIGSIKYKAENNFNVAVAGNGYITAQGILDNVKSFDDFRNYVVKQGFTADATAKDVRLYMPTRLIAGIDYRIRGHYYVNGTFIGSLANRSNFGNSFYDQFVITPRYDDRVFSVAVPVTYSTLSSTFKAGLGVRFTGFFIGSDDILAPVTSGAHGFNFYVGGFVPIAAHKMKDSDGDGVPDKRDNCPEMPGSPENNGCPDDMDMLEKKNRSHDADTTDNCPDLIDYYEPQAKDSNGTSSAKQAVNTSVFIIQMPGAGVPPKEFATLNRLAKVMNENPAKTMRIEGYDDNGRSVAKSTSLSMTRANSVRDYLASKGVDASRMTVKGLGSADPVADNSTPAGRAKNCRVVIRISK